jgi:single-strand DNA-binding protein
MNGLNSFELHATGRLAAEPAVGKKGEVKFALIGEDYAGPNRDPITTSIYFVAFGTIGEAIAHNVRKGDQLIIRAQVLANNYDKNGETIYGQSFIVQGFIFGAPGKAKRDELQKQAAS